MSTNRTLEYRVLSKPETYPVNMENIIDTMYSSFSFQVLQRHLFPIAQAQLLELLRSKKFSQDIKGKALSVIDDNINELYFFTEFCAYILLQRKHRTNENIFLPKKMDDRDFLREACKFYFLHKSEFFDIKIKEKEAEKASLNVLKEMKIEDVMPLLQKYHVPPLMKKEGSKEYEIKANQSKVKIDMRKADMSIEKVNPVYISMTQKKNPLGKVGYDEIYIGFSMKHTDDVVIINFNYPLIKQEYQLMEKRFSPKGKVDLDECLFMLYIFYSGYGLVYRYNFAIMELDIVDKKLKSLQEQSTVLIGTPLNVPENQIYFSLFPEVEKHFGSSGSFFEAQPITGVYSLIPPFPSFVFISYCLDRTEAWLNHAKKENRALTILFWYPYMDIIDYDNSGISEIHFQNNLTPKTNKSKKSSRKTFRQNGGANQEAKNNSRNHFVHKFMDRNLLKRLENVKHDKEIFHYYPGKKLSLQSKNYMYKVFVFKSL
jgi:hypothetical protein